MVGDQAGRFTYALIQLDDLLVVHLIGRTDPMIIAYPNAQDRRHKNYHWTYTTIYPGHFDPDPITSLLYLSWKPADPDNANLWPNSLVKI